ncbi:MAG: phosphoenolpyruvate synthase [Anaerolineae bacterium]|nr:phosphoenolpyruvate synthase [Anaerolineae bacterium]
MPFDLEERPLPKVLQLYLEISQYPVLSRTIRERMREELFARGIIDRETFEQEVHQKAVESQRREGLLDPLYEEPPDDWNKRVRYIRAHLTDFYFAYNMPHSLFVSILQNVLQKRRPDREVRLTFNPEIAPWDVLFSEGERYERLSAGDRSQVQHHLREIIVVLIKAMISDHLHFVGLAKEVFSIHDLETIRERRLGRGKIGGKAAGMLLAWKLIQHFGADAGIDPDCITIPDSYYIGADVFYDVHELNDFHQSMNQKYKPRDQIIAEYPTLLAQWRNAELPSTFTENLRGLLDHIGPVPLIFRSSSLLEDSFMTAFAGKYDSYFLPNNSTPDENYQAAKDAILRIYASTLSPDALIYRQRMGLVDFDERMAILIQKVEGQQYGRYYFPMLAGVGFSRNPFRWTQRIRREDGLLRLVCGLGTRAVERGDRDYPRMIALSHPHLRPETRVQQLRQYSQRMIDLLDIEANAFKTLPIHEVLDANFPALRLVAEMDKGHHLQPFISRPTNINPSQLVFTFNTLAREPRFTDLMRNLLHFLQEQYDLPVDIEYTVEITHTWPESQFRVCLLQCRTLTEHEPGKTRHIPDYIPDCDKLFSAHRQVPDGVIERVRYMVYVRPEAYLSLPDPSARLDVGRLVGRINERLKNERFVLMGPGRWGTSDIQLGIKVTYADIYNTRALIEIAHSQGGGSPEMAYGTHFFQDLVESEIFPLALFPHEGNAFFNWEFFDHAPSVLPDLLPDDSDMVDFVRVLDLYQVAHGRLLEIIMDADADEALGYLRTYTDDNTPPPPPRERHSPPLGRL